MGLISISDIEAATGLDIPEDEEPRYQWYIDTVSAYIETYTGVTFSEVLAETFVVVADGRGVIEFPQLNSVTLIEGWDPYSASFASTTDWWWDASSKIYGLDVHATYRVTVGYGYPEVPVDIAGVITQLVAAGTGLDAGASGGLKSYRVGDVNEAYGVTVDGTGATVVTLSSLMSSVLQAYSNATTTYRL